MNQPPVGVTARHTVVMEHQSPPARSADGSAGDVDYAAIGGAYSRYRQPEPAIEQLLHQALGDATTVLNVGAGAGSYEPRDRQVTAVEPSSSMRAQRPTELSEAVDATAETLPFADDSFDAAMSTFSIHQWPDLAAGLAQLRRVTRGPVVLLSCDPARVRQGWLYEYFPEALDTEARRYPTMDAVRNALGGQVEVVPMPIPLHCRDGFSEGYYGRPELLLDPLARQSNSAYSFVDPDTMAERVEQLRADLADGTWDARHGQLRTESHHEGSLVLIIGRP